MPQELLQLIALLTQQLHELFLLLLQLSLLLLQLCHKSFLSLFDVLMLLLIFTLKSLNHCSELCSDFFSLSQCWLFKTVNLLWWEHICDCHLLWAYSIFSPQYWVKRAHASFISWSRKKVIRIQKRQWECSESQACHLKWSQKSIKSRNEQRTCFVKVCNWRTK